MRAAIHVVQGDLTVQTVDAIVNAANSTLLGGGGVDGAIHAAAGPRLVAECREVRRTAYPDGLPVGGAVATGAGKLPSRWVIHTVGPNWHRGQREEADLAAQRRLPGDQRRGFRVGGRHGGPSRGRVGMPGA